MYIDSVELIEPFFVFNSCDY